MSKAVVRGRSVVLVSHGFQVNYERGFSNGLCDSGVDVTLISSDRTDHDGLHLEIHDVNLRGSQEEGRSRLQKMCNMLAYHVRLMLYVLRHRSFVVHVIGLIDPPLLCGVLEGALFRLACHRYVLTVHDLLPHGRHTSWNKRLYGWSFRLPHHLVVHTARMQGELVSRYGLQAGRITVMEHGIEPMTATVRQDREIPALPRLLFFGRMAHYKGLDLLLTAMEALGEQAELLIVGHTRDAVLQADIETRINRHPWKSRITWRNEFVTEEEVADIFCDADALVLPYRHIDQSGVLFQALRYGLPVVASRVGNFEHYVSAELGELCQPESVGSLQHAISTLLARLNKVSRHRIEQIGRAYEWPRTAAVLRQAYEPAKECI